MNKYLLGLTAILLLFPCLAFAEPPTQVPEPSSLAIFGLAIAGLIINKIRKR